MLDTDLVTAMVHMFIYKNVIHVFIQCPSIITILNLYSIYCQGRMFHAGWVVVRKIFLFPADHVFFFSTEQYRFVIVLLFVLI